MAAYRKELTDYMAHDGRRVADTLLAALIAIAPDGKAQAKLSDAFSEAWKDGGYELQLEVMLGVALDGMKYGNWPWSKP